MERPPVDVKFESGLKSNQLPDISVWNYSCLVLSEAAKRVLDPVLKNIGEYLALNGDFTLFNGLDTVGGDVIDQSRSSFTWSLTIRYIYRMTLLSDRKKLQGRFYLNLGLRTIAS